MRCPCGKTTTVLDSRDTPKGRWRRRHCEDCGKFTTYEVLATEMPNLEKLQQTLAAIRALVK